MYFTPPPPSPNTDINLLNYKHGIGSIYVFPDKDGLGCGVIIIIISDWGLP
jgi:hypothetical protein